MKNLIIEKNEKLNVKPSKTKIMKTTIKNPKGFEKNLQELLINNGISVEIFKYKNFRITKTPNKKFPEMVTITRTVSGPKTFLGKSFINLQKVMVFIDYQLSLMSIEGKRTNVERQLISIGLGNLNF